MALDGCGLACKYILFIFNLIFAVVGFAFLGLGLWLRFSNGTRGIFEIDAFNSSAFVSVVTLLIVLGSVMLIVVVFGDYGACNEKRCALQVFSVLLSLLAISVVVVGVFGYSSMDSLGSSLAEFYGSIYTLYVTSGDPVLGVTITFIQQVFHCCGMTGIPLIELVKQTCPKPDGIWEHITMPNCPTEIVRNVNSQAPLVMGVFVGSGALLILALVCTIILLKQTKREQQEISAYYSTVY